MTSTVIIVVTNQRSKQSRRLRASRPSFDFEVNHKRVITSGRCAINYSTEICKYPDVLMLASDFCWAVKNAPLDSKLMEIISNRQHNRHLHHHKVNDVIREAEETLFGRCSTLWPWRWLGCNDQPQKKASRKTHQRGKLRASS